MIRAGLILVTALVWAALIWGWIVPPAPTHVVTPDRWERTG